MADPTISEKMKDLNKTLQPKEEKMETQQDLKSQTQVGQEQSRSKMPQVQ